MSPLMRDLYWPPDPLPPIIDRSRFRCAIPVRYMGAPFRLRRYPLFALGTVHEVLARPFTPRAKPHIVPRPR